MRIHFLKCILFLVITLANLQKANAVVFHFVGHKEKVTIIYNKKAPKLDSISAHLLAEDIQRVTGYLPLVISNLERAKGNVIVIGSVESPLIAGFSKQLNLQGLEGKWECYHIQVLAHPLKNISEALVVTGSDARGTAYGVFDISARIGVSAWYWWADATPQKKKVLSLNISTFTSKTPSVKYRGIFINDEDWGLQPWAAKTFEPETKDIGPKTYAKVFELLLRLKANLIWPAMHPSTKAFFYYPTNKQVAADYQIVVGSSHAEPMLRNNVGEWDKKTMGDFNYVTNSKNVNDYWESRIKESSNLESIYTIGMRGLHDSGIEGVKTVQETVPLVERIIGDQRNLLSKNLNKNMNKIPQAFTAYKEVLEVYDHNLKLPDDVTIIWPDDNYGYIQRLNTEQENNRDGGSGVYYHTSYWGRPHDYLWLNTTSPGLIREEMTKAYEMDARNIWVLNVGDIKPSEYNIQLFMDLAYQIEPFKNSGYTRTHLQQWLTGIFSSHDEPQSKLINQISEVLRNYYQLALARKPEFMGWSQTEPTTKTGLTAFSHQYYGDQAQMRIDAYQALEDQTKQLALKMDPANQASFYQLVYYPVVCASLMNKKVLYHEKASLYAKEGRLIANYYASLAESAYQQIITETKYYNESLMDGKWRGMMTMDPRNLPVFAKPQQLVKVADQNSAWQVSANGAVDNSISFTAKSDQKQFIDLYLTKDTTINYTAIIDYPSATSQSWIKLSSASGKLSTNTNKSMQRLWVNIDWKKMPSNANLLAQINIKAGNRTAIVKVLVNNHDNVPPDYKGFVENDGYVSIYAKNYTSSTTLNDNRWSRITDMGYTGESVEALPLKSATQFPSDIPDHLIKKQPFLSYDFYSSSTGLAEIKIYTAPTYPLNKNYEMRYAVSIDNGPATVLNFKTTGRTEEWKQNVLSNAAQRSVKVGRLEPGKHQLTIYSIDPGVIADRILIDLGGLKPYYGLIPETKSN